jgi:hypothetical protein
LSHNVWSSGVVRAHRLFSNAWLNQESGVHSYLVPPLPVTLYVEQWERLLGFADEIKEFMKENDSKLKRKEK